MEDAVNRGITTVGGLAIITAVIVIVIVILWKKGTRD